jgi:hypothetical protein
MRMAHYSLAGALLLAPALLATLVTGLAFEGDPTHLTLGLITAILCVAQQTLLILFMLVTGRVIRAAMQTRPLSPAFLQELNVFFARRRAYPLAVLSAFSAVAAAVLGYGKNIGVPPGVHVAVGTAAVLLNLFALLHGWRTLRTNQVLVDRVAAELDRLDRERAEHGLAPPATPEIPWAVGERARWAILAASAWGPYLYWGLVVWRGEFARVPSALLAASALVSIVALARALFARSRAA